MAIDTVARTFEDKNKRILWLPSITLGYLYTLTGDVYQLVLAIVAIGGTQFFKQSMVADVDLGDDTLSNVQWFRDNFSVIKLIPTFPFALSYPMITGYSVFILYRHFTHQDMIVVGLGLIWSGVTMVVFVNAILHAAYKGN